MSLYIHLMIVDLFDEDKREIWGQLLVEYIFCLWK